MPNGWRRREGRRRHRITSPTGDVLPRLNKVGSWAADVFRDCKEGAHEKFGGDVNVLIDDAKRLAAHVRGLA